MFAGRIVINLGMIVIFWLLAYSCFTMTLWCWRRFLRDPWTARRAEQSIFKKINPEYSWKDNAKAEAAILCPPMWTADSLEKTLMLGKTEGRRRKGWQGMRWLDGTTDSMDLNLGNDQEMVRDRKPGMLQCMVSHRVRPDLVTEEQQAGSNAALCSGTISHWHSVFGTKAWGICSLCFWFLLHACHFQCTDFWTSSDWS